MNIGQENVFYDILEVENGFLRYKKRKLKKTKQLRFFQRGQSMVLAINWPFFQLLTLGNIGQKNVFYEILERKNGFVTDKNKKLEKLENPDFSKGVFDIVERKALFQAIKEKVQKVKKLTNYQRGQSMCLVQNWPFFKLFFQAIQTRKICFLIFYNKITPFLSIKARSSKSRKIAIFPRALVHGFGPKLAILSTYFFLGNIGMENVFFDIVERNNAFLGYRKKKCSKSRKINILPKGLVHVFGLKLAIIKLFFRQYRQGKCVL